MKAEVAAFNQEKALVGAFSVIVQLHRLIVYTALTVLCCQYLPLLRSIPVLVPLIHISLTASVYTTVAVAVDRAATFLPHIAKVGTDNVS